MNIIDAHESWLSSGLPSPVEEEAEACFRSFDFFAQRAWSKLERDTRILWEPVHEAMSLHIQALIHGFVREKLFAFAQGFAHNRLPRVSTERLPLGKKEREAELRERARMAHIWAVGRRLEVLLENGHVVHRPQVITKLLVNVGTGMGKSKLACVMAPAYLWLLWPSSIEQSFSVNPRGASKESGAQMEVVSSDWWRNTFRLWWGLELAKPAASNYSNTAGGQRVALGWGAQAQGDHAHLLMVDDPEDPKKVFSDGERAATKLAWDTKISRRIIPGGTSIFLAVQQRLEEDDWSRYMTRFGWEHLELPTEMPEDPSPCDCETHRRGHTLVIDPKTGQGWRDCRKPKELIAPRLVPPKEVETRKATPAVWEAQDIQRPKKLSGNIFPEAGWWFWRFKEEPVAETEEMRKRTIVLPPRDEWERFFNEHPLLLSVDPSLGTQTDGSLDCLGVWGRKGHRRILLDLEWDAMKMRQARRAMRRLLKDNPNVGPKLVEKAVQGPGIVDSLTEGADDAADAEGGGDWETDATEADDVLWETATVLEGDVADLVKAEDGEPAVDGIILVQTKGSKVWRAISIQHLHAAGNIVLPLHHPKRKEMVRETKAFPKKGVRNDFVDMMSQALRYWQEQDKKLATVSNLYPRV